MVAQDDSIRGGRGGIGWVIPILYLMGASRVIAQLPTATILGVVKDSTEAVVPGATLTAIEIPVCLRSHGRRREPSLSRLLAETRGIILLVL